MSGRNRPIAISAEEYRRLQELDMSTGLGDEQGKNTAPQPQPDQGLKIETTAGAVYVDINLLYDLLGDENPGNGRLLTALVHGAPNFAARSAAGGFRRAVAMLCPQLIGTAQYQNQRREYAHQLLAAMQAGIQPVKQGQAVLAQPVNYRFDPAVRIRMRTAAALQKAVEQAGYQYFGIDYTDPARTTALVRLVRPSDNSRVTLVISQNSTLFDAVQPGIELSQPSPLQDSCPRGFKPDNAALHVRQQADFEIQES